MVSWRLVSKFDDVHHLFSDVIQTDYLVETYICSCGENKFIIKHKGQKIDYQCVKCGNVNFYDANFAWNNFTYFMQQHEDIEFAYEYRIKYMYSTLESLYVIKIPYSIDFISQEVFYGEKPIYTLAITEDGKIEKSYVQQLENRVIATINKNLLDEVNDIDSFECPKPKNKKITLEIAAFFLKNRHLKEFEFYYWDSAPKITNKHLYVNDAIMYIADYPKAKSIKKAIYKNYMQQMQDRGRFNSIAIEVFCKTINDSNIVVKLLDLPLDSFVSSSIYPKDVQEFILFLKGYYTEKQILGFFSSQQLSERPFLFQDMLDQFVFIIAILHDVFQKVDCKPIVLHNEFVRCAMTERYKYISQKKLSYTEEELKPCITVDNYQVRVPRTGQQLIEWAEYLHNCMAGYFDIIERHETMIYCFFHDNHIAFAVEITDTQIKEASGKYNRELTKEENSVLEKWFNQTFTQAKENTNAV